jgi:hypothetical protein
VDDITATVGNWAQWADPDAAWWAKLRRASIHIEDVRHRVREFEASLPWSVEPEPSEVPNETAFRLRVHRAVPVELVTVIGDAIHNLRSALDAVAYALARQHLGRDLNAEEEWRTEFPIKQDATTFGRYFKEGRGLGLYGTQQRAAMRCVQPFALRDEAIALGIDSQSSPELDLRTDELYRINRISVVDKHRRLPLLAWFPGLTYWTTPPDSAVYSWRTAPAPALFQDGTLIGYLSNPAGDAPPEVQVFHEFHLTLMDDPGYRSDLTKTLDRWHGYLTGWALPRLFTVAEGDPPPLMIGGPPRED